MKMTPCPLVMIEWEDSAQPVAAWAHLESIQPGGVVLCASVGWLIHDGEDLKMIAPNFGGLESQNNAQVSGVIRIPTRCVRAVHKLKEPSLSGAGPSSRPAKAQKRRAS